jgi:hypothetical protein
MHIITFAGFVNVSSPNAGGAGANPWYVTSELRMTGIADL